METSRRKNLKRKRSGNDCEHGPEPEASNRKKRKLNRTVEDDSEYVPTQDEQKEVSETEDEDYVETKTQPKKKKKATKTKAKGKGKGKGKGKKKKTAVSAEDERLAVEKEITRLKAMHEQCHVQGYKCVIGVDEAGRGPLAGPVVVGACYCPLHVRIPGIADSKKITEEMREDLYEIIIHHPEIEYAIAVLDNKVIDDINILAASLKGMRDSAATLNQKLIAKREKQKDKAAAAATSTVAVVDMVLVDGNRDPCFVEPEGVHSRTVVKGDANVYCIAAASILAKVVRDRMMFEYDKKWPIYQFAVHKGYPTPYHKQTVIKQGPCPIHRRTFRPVVDWVKIHHPEEYEMIQEEKKRKAEVRKLAYKLKKQKEKESKKQTSKPKPKKSKKISKPKAKKPTKRKTKKSKNKNKKNRKTKNKAPKSDGESFLISEEEEDWVDQEVQEQEQEQETEQSNQPSKQRTLLTYFSKTDKKV